MSDFTIYPAIDLRQGRVVRLEQGRADAQTTYGVDPTAIARDFEAQGARWLHVVNLDGAFGEASQNLAVLRAICNSVEIPVEFGGGLRGAADVENALKRGVERIILGTVALRNPDLVKELAAEYGDRIAVGIDAKDGMVAVEGWVETSEVTAIELAKRMFDVGVTRFIYTDIERDGMLVGPDLSGALEMATTGAQVIASGGVATIDHVTSAATAGPGVDGLIIGKALYEGRFTVRQALEACHG
ncbi:MAG: 1-(5-phosphoribosyl)-5-[(5-phosphoribosylamino)methylideneamino]imidazole-4-carboxamide isomerase [Planctomycetota bacterium]